MSEEILQTMMSLCFGAAHTGFRDKALVLARDPFDFKAITEKLTHKSLNPDVVDSIQVFPVQDAQKGLVICDDGEVSPS